jgi:hypothetical protein
LLEGWGLLSILFIFHAASKYHNNPLKGDPRGSDSSYAIRSKCAIKLNKFLKHKFMKKLETML